MPFVCYTCSYKMPFVIFSQQAAILHLEPPSGNENLFNIPHIVYKTKMKPVIQFDKQFIIVIFLMLLCTQRIFGYDLSLLTVRGILYNVCMCVRVCKA